MISKKKFSKRKKIKSVLIANELVIYQSGYRVYILSRCAKIAQVIRYMLC